MTLPVLHDCDTGIDDSFALMYLLAHPDVDLRGVISTAGNVPRHYVHENNRRWLSLTKSTDVPLHLGAQIPLVAPVHYADDAHAGGGLGYAKLPEVSEPINESSIYGAQAWIDAANAAPGELIGLITGPMTTFAQALALDPSLPTKLKRLVIMGGAFDFPGNTSVVSEWNIDWDPEAMRVVVRAYDAHPEDTLPIFCPLDITETIECHPEHIELLSQYAHTTLEKISAEQDNDQRSDNPNPLIRALSDAIRYYFHFHFLDRGVYFAHMHDPFAAGVAVDPEKYTTVATTVDVELGGEFCRGKTIADWRKKLGRANNAHIVTQANSQEFMQHYAQIVGNYAKRFNAE